MAVRRRSLMDGVAAPGRSSMLAGLPPLPTGEGDTRDRPRELPMPAPAPAAPPPMPAAAPAAPAAPAMPSGIPQGVTAPPAQVSSPMVPTPNAGAPRRAPLAPSRLFAGADAGGSRLFGQSEGLQGGGLGVPGRAGGSGGTPTQMMLALLKSIMGGQTGGGPLG